jgi:hypothetical protein
MSDLLNFDRLLDMVVGSIDGLLSATALIPLTQTSRLIILLSALP